MIHRKESAVWRNDERRATCREGFRIREFPPEVEPAKESKDFSETGQVIIAAQSPRKGKLRSLAHHHLRALPAGVGRREQKDAGHFSPSFEMPRRASSCGRYFSDQRQSPWSGSISVRPRAVSVYSTLGTASS